MIYFSIPLSYTIMIRKLRIYTILLILVSLVEANSRKTIIMSLTDKTPSFASRPRNAHAKQSLNIHASGNTKVDAWEKAELLKIEKRYKLKPSISTSILVDSLRIIDVIEPDTRRIT